MTRRLTVAHLLLAVALLGAFYYFTQGSPLWYNRYKLAREVVLFAGAIAVFLAFGVPHFHWKWPSWDRGNLLNYKGTIFLILAAVLAAAVYYLTRGTAVWSSEYKMQRGIVLLLVMVAATVFIGFGDEIAKAYRKGLKKGTKDMNAGKWSLKRLRWPKSEDGLTFTGLHIGRTLADVQRELAVARAERGKYKEGSPDWAHENARVQGLKLEEGRLKGGGNRETIFIPAPRTELRPTTSLTARRTELRQPTALLLATSLRARATVEAELKEARRVRDSLSAEPGRRLKAAQGLVDALKRELEHLSSGKRNKARTGQVVKTELVAARAERDRHKRGTQPHKTADAWVQALKREL